MQQTLDTSQNRRHVVRGRPPILQNVQTEVSIGIDVGVEHSRDEFDVRGFRRVGLVESEHELESSVFKWRVW